MVVLVASCLLLGPTACGEEGEEGAALPGAGASSSGGEAAPGKVALDKGPLKGFGKVGTDQKKVKRRRRSRYRSVETLLRELTAAAIAVDVEKAVSYFPSDELVAKHIHCENRRKGPSRDIKKAIKQLRKDFRDNKSPLNIHYVGYVEGQKDRLAKGTEKRGCTALSDVTILHVTLDTRVGGRSKGQSDKFYLIQFDDRDWYLFGVE
jgi:hypothetical protein